MSTESILSLTRPLELLELFPCSTLPLPASKRPKNKITSLAWQKQNQSSHNDQKPCDQDHEVEVDEVLYALNTFVAF